MAAERLPNRTGANIADEDLLPIRALNDLLFCERRCVLHHREKVWVENRYTLEGTAAHRKVHAEPTDEELGATGRLSRNVWLRSDRLKLVGVADLVEFRRGAGQAPAALAADGCPPLSSGLDLASPAGLTADGNGPVCWVYPIEYKRGPRRRWDNDDVQLCAQALCLEEMLGVAVPAGAIFHFKSRRRREILFDARLRALTEQTVARLHELLAGDTTPLPINKPRCHGCSLYELCLPEVIAQRDRYTDYLRQLYETAPDPPTAVP
jgi:CRISPR-associated exonuclease Cas4